MNYNWQTTGVGDRTANRTWTLESQSQHQLPPLQIDDPREAVVDNTDLDVSLTCDMKDVLMQYGMLLAALANAFVSLLTLVVQCNLSAACVKQRYASIIESLTDDTRLDSKVTRITCRERGTTTDEQESESRQQSNIDTTERSNGVQGFVQRMVEISKFQVLKGDNERPVGYLVTAHWLVPFLVVGILYFAEYDDMNAARHTEAIECIFESNFPMNDFCVFLDAENSSKTANSIAHVTLGNNYPLDEELLNQSKPSNVEINQIVSKVQDIVRTVLNYTRDSAVNVENINFRDNSSESRNITKYVVNDAVIYRENDTSIDAVIQTLYGTLMDHDAAAKEKNPTGNLGNVPQISTESKHDSYQGTTDTPIVRNATLASNNEIYNDIIKRIQAASAHSSAAQNHYDSRDNGKQPERNGLRKPHSIRHLSPSETDRFNQYINSVTRRDSEVNLQRAINKCLLSMKFLKLHLLALSFTIYFLPILLSCILQVRGRHVCKSALAMLKANVDLASTLLRSNSNEEKISKSFLKFWLSVNDKKARRRSSVEESDAPRQEPGFTQSCSNGADVEAMSECHETHTRTQSQNTLEIDSMVRILDTVKLSLILCVLLWTPIFLETLLRAFSCTQAPRWWNSVTFSSAVSFGIVRNALNISIMRIQEVCDNAGAKENKVHPIK
ncbi:hypothetical protein DMN91_008642 [Ooceraea biroi]|uniref:Uncharacterized protein n=1 Tax=Ooceraea biroi TaxID=2015173 RepID=A0A3L8DDA3_OOCBI|nr:uncharacterized protein LOC105283706 [Ooceraea biroi]RLU18286.1 hypothetical protein DMN91_008642 [Ooceraea biroi]